MELIVSERESNARYIAYIYTSLMPLAEACGAKSAISFDGERIALRLSAEEKYEPCLRRAAEEKLAEVVAIGYKYELFRRALHPAGLNKEEKEILLAALIAADFLDDKRYVFTRLHGDRVYTLDGFCLFRLAALKKKWEQVIDCVPVFFSPEKLAEFLRYLAREEAGGKIFVRGEEIYDGKYRRMRRATLIEEGISDMNGIREIILSGADEVECAGMPTPGQEIFFKRYYAGKVNFI